MESDHQSQKFLSKRKISDFPFAEKIYSLLNITEDIAEKANLRVLDEAQEDCLILVHYFTTSDYYVNQINHIRGVIIDTEGENPKIVAESFPRTPEFEERQIETLEKLGIIFDPEENTVTQAFEGTILRVFRGAKTGKWYVSTHKKIDGRNSRWSGPSFGQIFDELWGSPTNYPYGDYLQKDSCYIFLVSHPENKLVCDTPESRLLLVGKFIPSVAESPREGILLTASSDDLNLIKPHPNVIVQTALNIKGRDDLFNQVRSVNWKECSGLLVYHRKQKTCHKFIPSEYSIRREIRGNEPNFRLRYLQLSKSDSKDGTLKTNEFIELFPEKVEFFKEVENNCGLLIPYLEKFYINRYRNGDDSIIPKEEHFILEKTRRNYDPEIDLSDNICGHVKLSNARQVNAMIKHMITENKKKE